MVLRRSLGICDGGGEGSMVATTKSVAVRWVGFAAILVGVSALGLGAAGIAGVFSPQPPPHLHQFSVLPSKVITNYSTTPPVASASASFIPLSVSIPSIGVTGVQVTPEGDPGGVLGVPAIQKGWGWWYGGSSPGAGRGTILLDGHVDWAGYGNGPARKIWNVTPGTVAVVYGSGGMARSYVAVSLQSVVKSQLATISGNLFSTTGPEQLVIVTCGGTFNYSIASWSSNIIATFVPVSGSVASHSA